MKNIIENKKRKYDLVVFGRVTIDLNPIEKNRTLDKNINFTKYLGGSAGNTAVGLARLGLKTAMVSCVSKDQYGKFLKNYLSKTNVDVKYLQVAKNGEKTGLTFTEMKSETESSILMYRDNVADLMLEPCSSHEELIKSSSAIVISGTALSKSPSREAVLNALILAERHNTQIIFDIDYRPYTWRNMDETNIYYHLVAEKADVIVGSRKEFDYTEKIVNDYKSDIRTVEYFFEKKAKLIIIKHGSEGSVAFLKNREKYKVSIFPIKLLKSFGGGDAYISALIYGIMKNKTIEEALTYASAHAAHAVSSHSCSDALMSEKELENFLKEHKSVLPVVKKINL